MLSHVHGAEPDYLDWFQFRDCEHADAAVVQPDAGPGLPFMGVCELGPGPVSISDIRCR